jgi:molybdopterin/thiamine biosynthesis adenylyltransferase
MHPLLASELQAFSRAVGAPAPTAHAVKWAGTNLEALRVVLPGDTELLLIAGSLYPGVPPLALVHRPETGTEQLQLRWDATIPATERLARALADVFVAPGPFLPVWGLSPEVLLTRDPKRARLAGWARFFSGHEPDPERFRAALRARSQGLLDERLAGRTVLLVGAGSVGSYLAEQLTRSGVEHWRLLDHDVVEATNLCRAGYTLADVGRRKAEALASRLLNIHPAAEVHPICRSLLDFTTDELRTLLVGVDFVLAATDDPRAQARINRFAFHAEIPALYVGLYAGAAAGEVVPVLPGVTPCYRCATGMRREMAALRDDMPERAMDYGTGRLVAEPALACDIQHVASAGVKLALSLLTRDAEGHVANFAPGAFSRGLHWLMLATTPDYGIFPTIHGANPGRYAYEGVWLSTQSHPDCPVCGQIECRESAEAPALGGLSAAALRAAIPAFADAN